MQLTQPELLVKLESQGYHVSQLFGGAGRLDNQALSTSSALYRSLVQSITTDLDASAPPAQFVVTARDDIPRRFDVRWLSSPLATFDLAGVVFRPYKADAAPTTCGEVRFVHHLRYARAMPAGRVAASRLPFLLKAVFDVARRRLGQRAPRSAVWLRGRFRLHG